MEFGRLHAAVRLVLPLLPAIAAASPIVEGELTANLDSRLAVYRQNQRLVPIDHGQGRSGTGIHPGGIRRSDLRVIRKDIARLDTDGVLDPEWVNSRGAIARFSRGSIEIRVIDAQESASMSVAVAGAAVAVVRALAEERFTSSAEQRGFHESAPRADLHRRRRPAAATPSSTTSGSWLAMGCARAAARSASCGLTSRSALDLRADGAPGGIDVILRQGTLSERILSACGRASASDLRRDLRRARRLLARRPRLRTVTSRRAPGPSRCSSPASTAAIVSRAAGRRCSASIAEALAFASRVRYRRGPGRRGDVEGARRAAVRRPRARGCSSI